MHPHGLTLALVGVMAAGGPCASINDAARSLDNAHRDAQQGARSAGEVTQVTSSISDATDGCQKLRFQEIAFDEERTIGETAAIHLGADNGGILVGAEADKATRELNRIGRVLADRSERPGLTWTFAILNTDSVNAYSTPGGLVFVTRGLLAQVGNEAQLAGVLAHEIAHVTGRHALNRYREMKVEQCNRCTAACAMAKVTANEAVQKMARRFSSSTASKDAPGHVSFEGAEEVLSEMGGSLASAVQHEKVDPAAEKQADYDAMSILVAANYQPEEYVKFLGTLPDGFQQETHPPKKDRVANAESVLKLFASDSASPLRSAGAPYGEAEGFKADPLSSALASIK